MNRISIDSNVSDGFEPVQTGQNLVHLIAEANLAPSKHPRPSFVFALSLLVRCRVVCADESGVDVVSPLGNVVADRVLIIRVEKLERILEKAIN